jgi:hypothetical protein
MKWRFAAIFLTAFAVMTLVWWATDFGELYRVAALKVVQVISPIVSGWFLLFDRPGIPGAVFRRGSQTLPMALQLPALSMGMMPLVSLIVATPGQSIRRTAVAVMLGCLLYFAVDVVVVSIYPLFMDQRMGGAPETLLDVVKDTVGVFSGLLAFVVAPLAIWFVVTYPALRSVWQLTAPLSAEPQRGKAKARLR